MNLVLRIIATFILFAAIAYYFHIDVRATVEQSGVPQWLNTHGIPTAK